MKKIVLATGGFDPIHTGHLEYLKKAKELGDILVVGINSDNWLMRKKGRAFMPLHERTSVITNLSCVDEIAMGYDDGDGSSIDALRKIKEKYPKIGRAHV